MDIIGQLCHVASYMVQMSLLMLEILLSIVGLVLEPDILIKLN